MSIVSSARHKLAIARRRSNEKFYATNLRQLAPVRERIDKQPNWPFAARAVLKAYYGKRGFSHTLDAPQISARLDDEDFRIILEQGLSIIVTATTGIDWLVQHQALTVKDTPWGENFYTLAADYRTLPLPR